MSIVVPKGRKYLGGDFDFLRDPYAPRATDFPDELAYRRYVESIDRSAFLSKRQRVTLRRQAERARDALTSLLADPPGHFTQEQHMALRRLASNYFAEEFS